MIFAVSLSEVTTLGCEIISPFPLFSIADSCRSSIALLLTKPIPKPDVAAFAPRSTNGTGEPLLLVGKVQRPAKGPHANPSSSLIPKLPSLPNAFQRPLPPVNAPPQRTPSSLP